MVLATLTTGGSEKTALWDGKKLTIDLEFPQGTKKMTWHEVWSGITATDFTQTGDMAEVGGPLKKAVTIHVIKSGDATMDL